MTHWTADGPWHTEPTLDPTKWTIINQIIFLPEKSTQKIEGHAKLYSVSNKGSLAFE